MTAFYILTGHSEQEKAIKIKNYKKFRGHPGLNQGPLDLQSNALPLSYIPLRLVRILLGIYR